MHGNRSCANARDGSASRARLVDGGYHSFISLRSGKVLKATEAQMISTQVWRISCEKISINAVSERPEEAIRVYAQDECSPQEWANISQCRQTVE